MTRPAKILIVDDDPGFRAVLSRVFHLRGYEIALAATGREVLEKVEAEAPDVILLDLHLDDLSGLELIRRVTSDHPSVRCILLTGDSSPTTVSDAFKAGVYDYLRKPYDLKQLLVSVQRALDQRQTGRVLNDEKE